MVLLRMMVLWSCVTSARATSTYHAGASSRHQRGPMSAFGAGTREKLVKTYIIHIHVIDTTVI